MQMQRFYDQVGDDWGSIPVYHTICSKTLEGLVNRGLVESRGINVVNGYYTGHKIRRCPSKAIASAEGKE
jgi:hypothetical protein